MTTVAFLLAIITVLIWSSSPALVIMALEELAPLQIAGSRYFGAFIILSPLLILRSRGVVRKLTRRNWLWLAVIGLLSYPIANGIFFWALQFLPSTTLSFILNSVPLLTLFLGYFWLHESPSRRQFLGVALAIFGAGLFFVDGVQVDQLWPVLFAFVGAVAIAIGGVMSRDLARTRTVDSATLSAIPLLFGGGLLILIAPPPGEISTQTLRIVIWLAVVNSALAYLMWNFALRFLRAFEISVVGNLMPIGTALLAPLLLGETVTSLQWGAMFLTLTGVILVGMGARARAGEGEAIEDKEQVISVETSGR